MVKGTDNYTDKEENEYKTVHRLSIQNDKKPFHFESVNVCGVTE